MSRSKRFPVYKDGGDFMKRRHHRAYRRMVKQACAAWLVRQDDDPVFKHPYKITDPYDICDWWCWADGDPKAYRK